MKVCLIHSPDYWSEWFENSIPKQINLRDPWKPPQTLNTIEWVHSIFFLTILATLLAMHWVPRLTKSFWFHEILHKTRYHIHNHSVWCKDNNFYDKSSFLKSWATCFEQSLFIIKPFNKLKSKIYSFLFRFKMLRKITRKLITEVHRVQQIM